MGIICKPYVHYLFIVCIINNMEFAYGYCDLKKMIKNVVSKMSNKGEIDKDTENKILESYRNVLKINISTESGYLTREGLLNSFYILFICFLEAYDISKTKILETTYKIFSSENKPSDWQSFKKIMKDKNYIKSFNREAVDQINPNSSKKTKGRTLEGIFYNICEINHVYYTYKKNIDLESKFKIELNLDSNVKNNKSKAIIYQNTLNSKLKIYDILNIIKMSCVKNSNKEMRIRYLKRYSIDCMERLQAYCSISVFYTGWRRKSELLNKESIKNAFKSYHGIKGSIYFWEIFEIILWLGYYEYTSCISYKTTNNTINLTIDLTKLKYQLLNCNTDSSVIKFNKRESKRSKLSAGKQIVIVDIKDATKEGIETSLHSYVVENPKSAIAEALAKGTRINVKKIDSINKKVTIVLDANFGKTLPMEAYDEMRDAYYSGCVELVEEYVKKLHFLQYCNLSDIAECLDEIISEAELDEEGDVACLIDNAEEFVENIISEYKFEAFLCFD